MEQQAATPIDEVRAVLWETLQISAERYPLPREAELFGAIPEFDSMAVVNVVTALEERLDIEFEDEEITAEAFATVGNLTDLVEAKLSA
jgi:acyl carrier protein